MSKGNTVPLCKSTPVSSLPAVSSTHASIPLTLGYANWHPMDIHPSLVCKGGCIGSGGPRGLGAPRGVGMLPFLPTCFLSPPCHSSHSIFHFGKWIKPPKCVVGSRQDLQKALGGTGSLLGWCVCVCTGEYHPRLLLYFC